MGAGSTALGDLVQIVGGGTPSTKVARYYEGEIPWVTPKDMKTWVISDSVEHISEDAIAKSATKIVPAGAVLVVIRSGVLKHTLPVAITSRPVAINQDMKALICSEHVYPPYLGRYLVASQARLLSGVRATTADNLPLDLLKRLRVPLPPLPEQRRIAAILDKADAVRRKRQQTLDLADQFLRSAFLGMFGDPVTNPKGWPMRCIADVAEDARGSVVIGPFGSDLKVADYRPNGHPVVFVRDVGEAGLQWVSRIYVDDEKFEQLAAHQVMPGDVVVTKMGTPPGIAAVYPVTMPIGVVTADIIRVRADSQKSQPQYLAAILNSAWARSQVQQITEGVTRPKITLGSFKRLLVPVPPLDEQARWAILLAARCTLTAAAAESSAGTGELLNSLLQRAFQGEL